VTEIICTCDAPPGARLVDHRTTCPVFVYVQEQLVLGVAYYRRRAAERATGRRCFRGAAHAIAWYAEWLIRRSSARGLPMDPDRVQASVDNLRAEVEDRKASAVIAALGAAEADVRGERRPVPIRRWLLQHYVHGSGRSFAWIAELEGWTELEVERRVKRGARVVAQHLRERRWLDEGGRRDDGDDA
jgi:hypothetical protein